jgi:hypothetical protein
MSHIPIPYEENREWKRWVPSFPVDSFLGPYKVQNTVVTSYVKP